jgi:hypothetical protein
MRFERFDLNSGDWDAQLATMPERLVCHSSAWLSFLAQSQQGEPVAAVLWQGDHVVGVFAGMVVRKLGLRILGSPFPGWTTPYMGLNLVAGASRRDAVHALVRFAFDELGCVHLEMMDRRLQLGDLDGIRFEHRIFQSWEVDVDRADDELLASFSRAARWCVRKAAKEGLVVEETDDPGFGAEFYAELQDVFARQRLVPTYPAKRVEQLIRTIPRHELLLLRVRTSAGQPAATGVFHALDAQRAYGWGFASWRDQQHLHPNELLLFEAMRRWRDRGVSVLDLAGSGDYKRKYHPRPIAVPWIRISKYAVIPPLRTAALWSFQARQRVLGLLRLARPRPVVAAGPFPGGPG